MTKGISSPCIGFCRIAASGLCSSSARTQEVTNWRTAPGPVRERIWAELPGRRAKLGIGLHRLDWTTDDIYSFVAKSRCSRRSRFPAAARPTAPTHFLPVHLAARRGTPPGREIPDTLVPCATYYPEAGPADSCA
jgi:predicted Fe-S protein YdhL (DUF1289 family)